MPNYEMIPKHCRNGMKRYIEWGVIPGDFLQAVISNNLKESFERADDINIERLFDYVNFLYNEAPLACWGSKETMIAWHKKKGESICVITYT